MHDNYILFSLIIEKYKNHKNKKHKNNNRKNNNFNDTLNSIKNIYEEYKSLHLDKPTFNMIIHGPNIGKIMSLFYLFYTDLNNANLIQRATKTFV